MDGIRFVETLAIDAEARDHHPDLLVRYSDVTVFLSTHSADGVTAKDLESAREAERISGQHKPSVAPSQAPPDPRAVDTMALI